MATSGATPDRNYGGASGVERRARRRADLIAAGITVFGGHGYRSSTIEQVCDAAGLTKRYFYESFSNREALLVASYRQSSDRMLTTIDSAAIDAGPDPAAQVGGVLTALFDFCRTEPEMTRIVLFEVIGVSEAVDAEHRASTDRFIATITRGGEIPVVEQLDDERKRLLGGALVGAALQLLREWVLCDYTPSAAAHVEALQLTTFAILERLGASPIEGPTRAVDGQSPPR